MRSLGTLLGRGVRRLWAHRWTFAVPVATLLLPVTLYAVHLPDTWQAKAVVHVRPLQQERIGSALPQAVTESALDLMDTVRDRVFARANLKAALEVLAPQAPCDDPRVLEASAKAFDWEQVGDSTFSVALNSPDRERAAEAVNCLLRAFLERERAEHLRRAESSRAFHARELAEARDVYGAIRTRVEAFRTEHGESLPDRKGAVEAELRRIEAEVTTQGGIVATTRARIEALEVQLAGLASEGLAAGPATSSAREEALRLRLAEEERALHDLLAKLANAESRYTEKHPDVQRLRQEVRAQKALVQTTIGELDRVRGEIGGRRARAVDARLDRRRQSLEALRDGARKTRDAGLEALATLRLRADHLHEVLQAMPSTAAAFLPLSRELDEAAKRLESQERVASSARAAADFYRTGDLSDVTGFQVSAWAVPPVQPSGPGRWRYLATAVILGLLAGYGLLLVNRYVQGSTIRGAADLAGLFPAAVVVGVPRLGEGTGRGLGAWVKEGLLTAYVALSLGASVFFLAAHRGWIEAPAWLQGFFGGSA